MSFLNVNNNYRINTQPVKALYNDTQEFIIFNNNAEDDTFSYQNKSEIRSSYEELTEEQGLIGKLWDGFKNIFGMKSGSKHLEKVITRAEKGEISEEEALKALEKFKQGQNTCVDVIADMASGILSIGAFALAVPTGGASLAVGLTLATAAGIGVKVGIKAGDAISTGKEYSKKDLLFDTATGALNGLLAPVTNGLGNCVTKTIGKKFGLKIIGEGAQQAASQGIKAALLNQTVDVAGGTILKRAVALGAGMAVDGALSGASDNMVRAALNGEDIAKAGIQGAVGGLIMAPVIGGGFRIAGKAGKAINNKLTSKFVLPDGINTRFKQGQVGDCALLSTIDGLMNNPDTADLIRKSITKSPFGDYSVKIGDNIVKVAKSSITDEMLSDTTGIKIFEQAYKQLTGNIDGGFAETVAKQFGLNPVHITNDNITDELLNQLAKEKSNNVLSFGALIDSDGTISNLGTQRHYFTIKDIDADNKLVKLTSPIDSSKSIELSFDDIKNFGISIDGGTIKKSNLPDARRLASDLPFKGLDISKTKSQLLKELPGLKNVNIDGYSSDNIAAFLDLYNIKPSEFTDYIKSFGYSVTDSSELEFVLQDTLKGLESFPIFKNNPIFSAFNLSLEDCADLYNKISINSADGIYEILEKNNPQLVKAFREHAQKSGTDIISDNLDYIYKHIVENPVSEMISADNILDLGIINGQRKKVILPNSTSMPVSSVEIKPLDLIKSNMMTEDLVNLAEGKFPLPERLSIDIKTPNSEKFSMSFATSDLIEKLKNFGIDGLSSNEIHSLTDMFSDMYRTNPKFAKSVNGYINNSKNLPKFRKVYDCIEYLKRRAENVLKGTNIEIEDHAFMRMIDRNMLTVTDNNTLSLLNFEDFIALLKDNVLKSSKNELRITGINGSDGLKVLLTPNKNGKIIIESVM